MTGKTFVIFAVVAASFFYFSVPPVLAAEAGPIPPAGPAAAAEEEINENDMVPADPAATEADTYQHHIADPVYPWNLAMYHFNDKFYFWLMKPLTQGYKAAVPEDFRVLFGNFYKNLLAPVHIINNLFQLKFDRAGIELLRMAVNTTMGVGGLRDCARACYGIRGHREDLGQTLGFWGAGHGFYIVWPVLGPSSLRDTFGLAGDYFLSPTAYIEKPLTVTLGLSMHEAVNSLSFRLGDYEAIKKAAIDPYVALRDGYVQHRNRDTRE